MLTLIVTLKFFKTIIITTGLETGFHGPLLSTLEQSLLSMLGKIITLDH